MEFRQLPFSKLLQDRATFAVFHQEFQKGTWLDVAALVGSESCIDDAYKEGTIPEDVLDAIVVRLEQMNEK